LPRLAQAKVDRVNLEFAYPATGDVSDLKLLPDHLDIGMGRSARPVLHETQFERIRARFFSPRPFLLARTISLGTKGGQQRRC